MRGKKHTFTDLDEGHWAYEAIDSVYSAGWVAGYSDNTFLPDVTLTRAEFVTIVETMLGRVEKEVTATELYQDVSTNHWAFRFIMNASVKYNR